MSERSGTRGALMPLCSPSSPPSIDARANLLRRRRLDLELHLPVIQQQAIALLHLERQLAIRGRDAARPADLVADRDHQRIAFLERIALPPSSRPVRIFGPLRSCRIADVAVGARRRRRGSDRTRRHDRPACHAKNSGASRRRPPRSARRGRRNRWRRVPRSQ